MRWFRRHISAQKQFVELLLALNLALVLPSCGYLVNRGLDFTDQFRVVVGASSGGGIRWSAWGLVHTGVNFGIEPHSTALGWKYGRPRLLSGPGGYFMFDADQAWVIETVTLVDCAYTRGDYAMGRSSFALAPAAFTWVDSADGNDLAWLLPAHGVELDRQHYLWTADTWRNNRYAMIHAFDNELEIGAIGYLDLGWSPGETVDFLLGIFTIDLAGDDRM